MEFPGMIKRKSCGIRGSWSQALKLLRRVTQFCGVSRGEALSGISNGKVNKLKIPGRFSKKYALNVCFKRMSSILKGLQCMLHTTNVPILLTQLILLLRRAICSVPKLGSYQKINYLNTLAPCETTQLRSTNNCRVVTGY